MSGRHGCNAASIPKCKHGVYAWGPCDECLLDRKREWEESQAHANAQVKPYHDMIANRRRWFDGCAFCPHDALVIRTKHEHDCPYLWAMFEAAQRFAVYLVRQDDPATAERLSDPRTDSAKGKP